LHRYAVEVIMIIKKNSLGVANYKSQQGIKVVDNVTAVSQNKHVKTNGFSMLCCSLRSVN